MRRRLRTGRRRIARRDENLRDRGTRRRRALRVPRNANLSEFATVQSEELPEPRVRETDAARGIEENHARFERIEKTRKLRFELARSRLGPLHDRPSSRHTNRSSEPGTGSNVMRTGKPFASEASMLADRAPSCGGLG